MLNLIVLIMSIFSCLGMLLALIPCLGALNWINIPFAVVTLILAIVAYMRTPPYEDKGKVGIAIILSALAIVIGFVRLIIGGGVI